MLSAGDPVDFPHGDAYRDSACGRKNGLAAYGAQRTVAVLSRGDGFLVIKEDPDREATVCYEAEGTYTNAVITPVAAVQAITQCDMLENEQGPVGNRLSFRPFEIKTLKLSY